MAQQPQTPGVYVQEIDGFSSSVVEVPTAIPVFIGYTEYAKDGNQSLLNVPMAISSMVDYATYFVSPTSITNGAPVPKFTYTQNSTTTPPCQFDTANQRFNLYYSLLMFFNNGGGNCYVMSIGSYTDANANGPSLSDYAAVFTELEKFAEPTIIVTPDAMLLPAVTDWTTLSQEALQHCAKMASRVAIFDIYQGYLPLSGVTPAPITSEPGFSDIGSLGEDFNKYGMAYYPWVNTNVVAANTIDYTWLTAASLPNLVADLLTESSILFPPSAIGLPNPKLPAYQAVINALSTPAATPAIQNSNHKTLLAISPLYKQTMSDLATSVNLLPPSGGMAGVFARNDNTFGVYQSPANTGIISAISPAVTVSDDDQSSLNMPLNGMAVNAIRTFPNYGLLVWGARTMAGNSDDWRYISVRRTMIMLEQSIKIAMQAYVFQANDNLTWIAVNSTISNFLNSQWKVGALQGAKASDAFSVSVGLGSTMTGEDILQGYMNVLVKVAVVRPAEFIILTFQQQMQTS